MVEKLADNVFHVYSELNEWMSVIFLIHSKTSEVLRQAEEVLNQAFEDWYDLDDDRCWADYLSDMLEDNGIKYSRFWRL